VSSPSPCKRAPAVTPLVQTMLADRGRPSSSLVSGLRPGFVRHRNQLLIPAGVHDFTVRDLTFPRPDRLRYILSAVINFFFFAEEQGERVLRPLEDEMNELAKEEVALIEENQKLREKIEEEKYVAVRSAVACYGLPES
jgi:hypothetical protein